MEEEGGRERTLWRNGKTGRGSGEDTGEGAGRTQEREMGARGPLMETEARRRRGGRSQGGLDKG